MCGQHGRQELCHHDREGHQWPLGQDPSGGVSRHVCSVKDGKPVLKKKVMSVVATSQSRSRHRKEGIHIYFEDNAGVIVNMMREMEGSAITRRVSQDAITSRVAYTTRQPHVTCSSDSSDCSDTKMAPSMHWCFDPRQNQGDRTIP